MTSVKDVTSINKKINQEIITPHRLTIAILICEFCKFRNLSIYEALLYKRKKQCVKNFCILILKLTQSPDLSLEELKKLLLFKSYNTHEEFVEQFDTTLHNINFQGIGYLLDVVEHLSRLMTTDENAMRKSSTLINRNSVIGYYLRRLLVNFDKLTFSEVIIVYQAFKKYYNPKKGHSNECAQENTDLQSADKITTMHSDDWYGDRDQWSKRQAELFIATQAALLTNNEEKALNPKSLSKHIKNLLTTNSDLAEAHFLSYLNYLRVKEYCGAVDSLYHCFDKTATIESKNVAEEKTKVYRYAALNLAILHFHFDHRDEALAAIKEAIMLAQEANDNVCLQHALSWLYCLSHVNKDKLLEHSILKSLDLNLTYIMSLGIQSFVQYAGITSGNPKQIFETITKSDIVNCQHTYKDLISSSYAQKSGLWLFYGKTEMSAVWGQLLLHLNTDNPLVERVYNSEALCQAVCNVSKQLLMEGEYAMAHAVLSLARESFPNEPINQNWILCENIFIFIRCLHHQQYTEAEIAAKKMATVDVWESQLRIGELLLQKSDYSKAYSCITAILDKSNGKIRIDYQIRAMILLAEIQCASTFPNAVPPGIIALLNSALANANEYHIDYLATLIHLHISHILLLMDMPAQSLKLVHRCLVQILAHGGNYDRARAMLLLVKCSVANSSHLVQSERKELILNANNILTKVINDFKKVEAYSRVKDALYLQANLYNEIDMISERNNCALDYKLFNEEYPTKSSSALITVL